MKTKIFKRLKTLGNQVLYLIDAAISYQLIKCRISSLFYFFIRKLTKLLFVQQYNYFKYANLKLSGVLNFKNIKNLILKKKFLLEFF